jgi:predicted GIY-YIG superfamily endonuclease
MPYLYRHIRKDTNLPFYIGIGSDTFFKRAHSKHNRNKYWKNLTNKIEYSVDILLTDITWETACKKEKEFIKLYKSCNIKLVNLTSGGEGLFEPDIDIIKKISESKKGNKNPMYGKSWSIEKRENMINRMTGKNNPNFGKTISQNQKAIISKAQIGRVKTQEEKEKIYSKTRKKVVDTVNNIIYNSIQEVADIFKKSPSHMTRLIKANKFNLKFL